MRLVKLMADPFPPYQYYTDGGEVKGIDYQIIKESFLLNGFEIEVKLKEWGELAHYFDQKLVHALFQVQPTEEREKIYLFSDVLRNAKTSFFSRTAGRRADSIEELLNGGSSPSSPLGVLNTYSYGKVIDSLKPEMKKGYGASLELLTAVDNGEVEHCVFDYGVAVFLIQENRLNHVHPVEGFSFSRPLAVAFQKDAEELCRTFNTGLKELKENGRYEEILNGKL